MITKNVDIIKTQYCKKMSIMLSSENNQGQTYGNVGTQSMKSKML